MLKNPYFVLIPTLENSMKRSLIILPLLFLVAVSPALRADTYQEHLERGDLHYAALNNEGALEEYEKAHTIAPEEFETLLRMTRIYNDLGRLALRRSEESEPMYRKAVVYAEKLHDRFPERAESYFMLALCHGSLVPFKTLREKLEIGRDVEENARKAIEIDPNFSMAYVVLGIFYRGISRLGWFEKLVANTIFGKNLTGTLEDSETMLLKAIELESDNSFAHFELAWTYRAMEQPEKSVAMLQKVVSFPPRNMREKLQQEEAQRRLEGPVGRR